MPLVPVRLDAEGAQEAADGALGAALEIGFLHGCPDSTASLPFKHAHPLIRMMVVIVSLRTAQPERHERL